MTQVRIAETQRRLPELLSAAGAGEVVTIGGARGRTFALTVLDGQTDSLRSTDF